MTMNDQDEESNVGLWIADAHGARHDLSTTAARYIAIRNKAARANEAWLETSRDEFLNKRNDYLFRSAEIVATIRDILGHDASTRFATEANRAFGPVRFWPYQANHSAHDELPVAGADSDAGQAI